MSSVILLFRELAKEGNIIEIHSVIIYRETCKDYMITGITKGLKEDNYEKTFFRNGLRFTETEDADRLTIEFYKDYIKSLDDERYGL